MTNKVLILSGPTATGKTSLGIRLACELGGEVVNFDSLLFYRELNIGTAKPGGDQMRACPHHLINIASIKQELNAADFVTHARAAIEDIHRRQRLPILVGGSGFYLRALIKGMLPATTPRKEAPPWRDTRTMLSFLRQCDPDAAHSIHPNDHYRLERAALFVWHNQEKFSRHKQRMEERRPYDFSCHAHPGWAIHHLHVDLPKEEHIRIIAGRAGAMVGAGLVGEVEDLLAQGFSGRERPLRSIGHRESLEFIEGKIPDTTDLIRQISTHTRQLAKAQRTFFGKITPKHTFHPQSAALGQNALAFARGDLP